MSLPTKQIVIIAGPNGAGKTTFFQRGLPKAFGEIDFLNADEIAAQLCPENPGTVAVRAGRIMLETVAQRISRGASMIIETTLSGRAYARSIPKWQAAGYTVFLFFLSVPSPDVSVARVRARVRHGGHHIPERDIRRRFDKGIENFHRLYRPLVDFWFLYDNASEPPRLIGSGEKK